jgi:hypothetical protein
MKRFVFLILLIAVAFWLLARARHEKARTRFERSVEAYRAAPYPAHDRGARRGEAHTHEHITKTLTEAKAAIAEARHAVKDAYGEARHEVHTAIVRAHQALASARRDLDAIHAGNAADTDNHVAACQDVEGIPVPVVPGTRVTDAVAQPPEPAQIRLVATGPQPAVQAEKPEAAPAPSQPPTRSVDGRLSVTEERAKHDAYLALASEVHNWLDPEVPRSWGPPAQMLQAMVQKTDVKKVPWHDETMYMATLTYDAAPSRRNALVATYNHELVRNRMTMLGGALAFILIALGAISGYIRADEATKGYYTNRLRMLAAAGVGAGGVLIFQMLR